MTLSTPAGYRPLDDASLRRFLADLPDLAAKLGGAPADWSIVEVGDGNLNLVFLIDGPAGSLCVKQSLPYVRAAGESWPLPLDRAFFEQAYYRAVAPFAAATGVNAVGVDWTVPLRAVREELGGRCALQGNLDPMLLVAGGPALDAAMDEILDAMTGARFIFNLGHGIVPETPIAHVEHLIRRVRG